MREERLIKKKLSCFLARERAADSLFLIIRLCRRSLELLMDGGSGHLFLPLALTMGGEQASKASNETLIGEQPAALEMCC